MQEFHMELNLPIFFQFQCMFCTEVSLCTSSLHYLKQQFALLTGEKRTMKSKLSSLINSTDVRSSKVLAVYKFWCHIHNYGG